MSNKILENWKEIEEIEQQVKDRTNDPEARFNASTFWLGSKEGRHLMIPCMYRTKKGQNFSKSYKEMMVYAKFCPFSGKPLYEQDSSEIE
jgi:hypothetical protein